MTRWLRLPSIQIALCLAVYALVGWKLGPFALVLASPLLAAAIARPLLTLLANFRHGVREQVWRPVLGQHYAFKGTTIRVLEDHDHCRWVCLADVRKVVGTTASERALAVTYADRVQQMGRPGQAYLRDDALIEHLSKENNPVALRFRTWAERDIAQPAKRIRKGLGIRTDSAGGPEGPAVSRSTE